MEAGCVAVMALPEKVDGELVVDGDLLVGGVVGEFRVVLDASKEAVESVRSDTKVTAKEIGSLVTNNVKEMGKGGRCAWVVVCPRRFVPMFVHALYGAMDSACESGGGNILLMN